MPDKVDPDADAEPEEETAVDSTVSCIVIALGPLQLTLEKLVRLVTAMALSTLLLTAAVLLVSL